MSQPEDLKRTIEILAVDSHELVRLGLREVSQNGQLYAVVAEASTNAEALRLAADVHPDVVVIDIDLPDGSGLRATRTLRNASSTLGIVILTDDEGGERLLDALYSGASGYVSKSSSISEILTAIRHAADMPLAFAAVGTSTAIQRTLEARDRSARSGEPDGSDRAEH
jgi:DNA-binding NarL/FixJ family response regulator